MAPRTRTWLACIVFAALIFSFDVNLPLGVAAGAFYVIIVLFTVRLTNRWDTPLVAGLCTLLMAIGAWFSPPGTALMYAIVNRCVSLIAVWATAYAIIRFRDSQAELAALNSELEARVEERSADAQQRAETLSQVNASLEREVKQREQAEIQARDSQAVYASLVEDLPIPIIRKDAEGRFLFANQAFCSWVGHELSEISGKTDADFAPPALAEKYRQDDLSVIKTGELFLDIEKNEHGGKVNWVHVIKTPARDGDGKINGTQAIFWDVTAKRIAEDRLRESEDLYHSLVDTLPLCLLRKDVEGKYTFVNKRWCEYFNVQAEDLLGKTDFDLFPPEIAKVYRDGDAEVMNSGDVYEDVELITLPDGRERSIDVVKAPVRDSEGAITGVQIILRDVTEELELEAQLKQSEQRLQAVLENTSAVVYIKDAEGRYLLINREYEALFGVDNEEVRGKTDYDLFPREFADAFRKVDQQVLQRGQTIEIEEVAPQPDGLHTYVSSKFPLKDETGAVYAIAGISTDITAIKRTESQLRESQQRLNLALTSAEIGAWSWDVYKGEAVWDDRMHDIFGMPRGSFAGTSEAFFDCLHPEDLERVRQAVQSSIDQKEIDLDVDFRIVWPDGTVRHITSRGAAVRGEDKRPARVAGVCLDITERKHAEQQLKEYASRLEATNRELEEFAYIISHDLQEPLRTLQFFSDSLQVNLKDQLDEQSRADLQFITDAAQRMQQLVRDLLALSRTGRAEMKKDRVPLQACLDDAMSALSNRVRETGATVDIGDLPEVRGDRVMLTQVFQNLIGNAFKFVPEATSPHVSVTAHSRDGMCEVCVADNGIGIKPEYAKKIFAPFQRLHASAEYEGTGIGLAICRKVVRRHGGRIWVDPSGEAGAKFCFALPLAGTSAPPASQLSTESV